MGGLHQRPLPEIPPLAIPFVSERAKKVLTQVERFVDEECIPAEGIYEAQVGVGEERWQSHPAIMDDLKKKARELGLWNLFLPKGRYKEGAQFTNVEYGLMAEQLGKSLIASEACNCSAPDTGNMEVLARYGSAQQKAEWLAPLLAGEIRSAFLMTEPDVASSDGTNIKLSIQRKGEYYVLNGSKWWASGAGDHRCKIFLVMGMTDPDHADRHRRQSIILVPPTTPGVTIHRMLSIYGYDDAPHGHGVVSFTDVKVPLDAIVLGEGRGNEIMQGRLGPGRIHLSMRAVGVAERALEWMIDRLNDERKQPFGTTLKNHGVLLEWVAHSRIDIDTTRLVVLNAAAKIDLQDAQYALREIAEAKLKAARTVQDVLDHAIQVYGAQGVCQDTPLAGLWARYRTLSIADGPDQVHLQQMGRRETNHRKDDVRTRFREQQQRAEQLWRSNPTTKLTPSGAKL